MAQPTEIRPVRRDDFAAWKELWDGYNAFYGRSGSTALAPEVTQTTWTRFFGGPFLTGAVKAIQAALDR
jgi:hypothetical protein